MVVSAIITSLNPAWAMPSISRRKRKLRNGSMRAIACLLALRLSGVLEDAEDHELGRPHRRDADLADQAPVEDVVLRHRGAVAGDEERLLLRAPEQRAQPPLPAEEQPHRVGHARPEAVVVRLE